MGPVPSIPQFPWAKRWLRFPPNGGAHRCETLREIDEAIQQWAEALGHLGFHIFHGDIMESSG